MSGSRLLAVVLACLVLGCDRNIEPFDASEQPQEPDLSKIFPEGAERATRVQPGLPEPPSQGAPPLADEVAGADAPDGGEPISGTVRLADGLAAPVPPGAVLFIIARRGGPGPPLAVKRVAQPSFPLDFVIGPDDRMIQAMPFVGPFQVTARVDADGNATSRDPGDLQGTAPGSYAPGASAIDLVIDEAL